MSASLHAFGHALDLTEREAYAVLRLLPAFRAGSMEEMEIAFIRYHMDTGAQLVDVAERMGCTRKTLWKKRRAYGIAGKGSL